MAHDDYIGYALNLLDAEERQALESRLAEGTASAAQVNRARAIAAWLELDGEPAPPPPGLASRTLAKLAAELEDETPTREPLAYSTSREATADRPGARTLLRGVRGDLVAALGIGIVFIGLALSFVSRARHASEVLACQNNLLTLHQGLSGYADTHQGRFPQVGTDAYPTADSFVKALKDAGQCPAGFQAVCPAASVEPPPPPPPVTYTYALGHRAPNNVVLGEWRSSDPGSENDLIPIAADCPTAAAAPGDGPLSAHRTGHNVLFVGGNVRFAKTAAVGINGDDIYRNQLGAVAAGLNRVDTVLGRAGDVP